MKTHNCLICGTTKPISEFGDRGDGKPRARCKKCERDIRQAKRKVEKNEKRLIQQRSEDELWRVSRKDVYRVATNTNNRARNRRTWLLQEIGIIPPYDLYLKMEAQDWCCIYCGDKISLDTAQLEHVEPLCKGGAHYLYNVFFSCRPCNAAKGQRRISRFCQKKGFDVDQIRQKMADINHLLHRQVFGDD